MKKTKFTNTKIDQLMQKQKNNNQNCMKVAPKNPPTNPRHTLTFKQFLEIFINEKKTKKKQKHRYNKK